MSRHQPDSQGTEFAKALDLFKQWIIKVFWGEGNKVTGEMNRLLNRLKENPADTANRMRLAELYLQNDDQKSAFREYQKAAKQLSTGGFDLEPIVIYKKLRSLDALSLTKEASASFQEAEGLLLKAKKTYEEIFRTNLKEDEAKEVQPTLIPNRKDALERPEIGESDDSEPIPIEMLVERSQDSREPAERPHRPSPEQEASSATPLPSAGLSDSDWDMRDSDIHHAQDPPVFSDEETFEEKGIEDLFHGTQMTTENVFSHAQKDLHIDIHNVQVDDDLEAILFGDETEPFTDNSLAPQAPRCISDDDLIHVLQRKLREIKTQDKLAITDPPSRGPRS
ncbi:MAG: hypothetical protein GTO12_15240 [Proteobacteria bacterium]|nr:hypothetical protein [Pseudomonadota bacterium]